jgi:hypothetical protein
MAHGEWVLSNGRTLVFGSQDAPADLVLPKPFAALVTAFNRREREAVEVLAAKLVESGCSEICCVGPCAEELHDGLDRIVEARGLLAVVTTWHTNLHEACEHFLFAAVPGAPVLLALVAEHPELVGLLKELARDGASLD